MATWVHQLIETAPDAAWAVIDADGQRYSYGALRNLTGILSDQLAAHGVRPGDRVMLVCENCASYAVAVMAASRLAAWIVPVNARHTGEELRAIRDHCGARCMLFTASVSTVAQAHADDFGADASLALGCGDLRATACADVRPEPVEDDPGQRVAALLYTTGTTSAPKAVMLTHRNLCWNGQVSARLRDLTRDDLVLAILPGSHIFGFSSTLFATFHIGACARFEPRFTPEVALRAFAEGVSAMPAVPQMYERILTHLDSTGATLNAPRLRYISAGGAPLDPDLKARVESVFGLALNNGYGITECSPTIAATRPDAPRGDVSCGTALWDVNLSIDAPDADGIGEIVIESPGVMKGYYRNPEATAAALPRAGVFRSGDLGRIDPDGALHVLGRLKELIIRSGFNVYPPEIEAMLTRHDDVLQAAVVPRKAAGNEEILAFVMARNGLTETALADWLRPRLVAYKQPQDIFIVDAFPIAPTGKVLKHKLVSHFAERLAARDAGRKDRE
ncbi:MAG: AMP-binding protein [Rhodobacter sp.]|nr:AMP-binding protein [Rhodobacter sp.]